MNQVTPKEMHVAVGVVRDDEHRVLIAHRAWHKEMGGLWEFPGGKCEPNESVKEALARELQEELGIVIGVFDPLIRITCPMSECSEQEDHRGQILVLHVWNAWAFSGDPRGAEGQKIHWVTVDDLKFYEMLPSNQAIVSALKLPEHYVITGNFSAYSGLVENVSRQLEQGMRLFYFRARSVPSELYLQYARQLAALCHQFKAKLLLQGIAYLKETWCDGVHVQSMEALKLCKEKWHYKEYMKHDHANNSSEKWLAVSCHNLSEMKAAEAIGAHFVTLSPVCLTLTHPEAIPLGFDWLKN